jgi:hypothetical protein
MVLKHASLRLVGALFVLLVSAAASAGEYVVSSPPAEMKLDSFYKKHTSASGYPIVGSEKVSDYALREAAYLIDMMLAKRPDVRQAMIAGGSRMVVMAYNEFTTDVPEHAGLVPKDFWDARARGLGGSQTDPVCSCAEENLLGYAGDPYRAECILIHEFAHNIHLRGMVVVDPTFDGRVEKAYREAMANGLWKGKYAATNHHEYFAEGVQSWFNNNRPPDHDHNHVDTRQELAAYDGALAALCEEVFGETELTYTRPETRLRDHLEGYDPSQAPTFTWPERLNAAKARIRRQAERRSRAAEKPAVAIEHETQSIEGWTVHVDKRLLAGDEQELGDQALRLMRGKLFEISLWLPPKALEKLREAPIWLDLDHPLTHMQYHPSADWLRDHGHDEAMAQSVHIPNAELFIEHHQSQTQPACLLHELAHAYHERVLGYDDAAIRENYERAVAEKKYESVLHVSGQKQRHYLLTNPQEYFAELTEAWFSVNDFYPFVRAELKEVDPESAALLERVWSGE